jgi:3-oxoadipate enol-lactonase
VTIVQHVRLSRADLHYRIDGAGPPVILLHGAGGSSLAWFQQAPAFSREFTTVAVDLPGFGLSTWTDGRAPIAEILEELVASFGWPRVGVVAHSLGGWGALRLAVTRPDRVGALVLSSTWAGLRLPGVLRLLDEREPDLQREQTRWREGQPGSHLPGLGARMASERPELHWLAAGISAQNRGAGRATWVRDSRGSFDKDLMPETEPAEVQGWSIPTMCLAGEEDVVVPPAAVRLVADALGGAELQIVEATGHSIFLQRADTFNAIALRFLREHAVGR